MAQLSVLTAHHEPDGSESGGVCGQPLYAAPAYIHSAAQVHASLVSAGCGGGDGGGGETSASGGGGDDAQMPHSSGQAALWP